ncbi:40S ribosomal protein S0 [Fusarium oxysporum f. sp. albedinis]|nr:40S ribosomal protein S0 [Fusarium oxysporum f. sp. albedinis]
MSVTRCKCFTLEAGRGCYLMLSGRFNPPSSSAHTSFLQSYDLTWCTGDTGKERSTFHIVESVWHAAPLAVIYDSPT